MSARLSRVEKSLAQFVGAAGTAFGTPVSMVEWVRDVTERLERMEMLLFSCNFEHFNEIDKLLQSLRKDSTQESLVSFANVSEPGAQDEGVSAASGMLQACPYGSGTSIGDRDTDYHEGRVNRPDTAARPGWDFDDGRSWTMGWAADRWDADVLDVAVCVNESPSRKTKGKRPCGGALHEAASNVFSKERWDGFKDPGEELSFDELIALRAPGSSSTSACVFPSRVADRDSANDVKNSRSSQILPVSAADPVTPAKVLPYFSLIESPASAEKSQRGIQAPGVEGLLEQICELVCFAEGVEGLD